MYGHVFGFPDLPTVPWQHGIGGLGPLVAALITTNIYRKGDGVQALLKKCVQFRPVPYLMIALAGPFILAMMAVGIYVLMNAPIELSNLFRTSEFPGFNLLAYFMYNLIFFGFGEELGWRGFALPRIQKKYNALVSSIILSGFWAVWHWPLFLYRPDYMSMDAGGNGGLDVQPRDGQYFVDLAVQLIEIEHSDLCDFPCDGKCGIHFRPGQSGSFGLYGLSYHLLGGIDRDRIQAQKLVTE